MKRVETNAEMAMSLYLSSSLSLSLSVAQKAMFVVHGVSLSPNSLSEAHACFWLKIVE